MTETEHSAHRTSSPLGCLETLWAVEETRFRQALSQAKAIMEAAGVKPEAQAQGEDGEDPASIFHIETGIAVIDIVGVLTKYPSWWQRFFGGTSHLITAERFLRASSDDRVQGIMAYVDSPGGTVSGMSDLIDAIRLAKSRLPVWAFISDLGASAAFEAACQADRLLCNRDALVGCIGTYCAVYDWSKFYDELGVKVHVISSGGVKGGMVDGTPIRKEVLDEQQRVINELREEMDADVAAGRGWSLERAKSMADGRLHVGEHALSLGLVDGVTTFADAVSQLRETLA